MQGTCSISQKRNTLTFHPLITQAFVELS